MDKLILKIHKISDKTHEIYMYTQSGEFLASSNLVEANKELLEIDRPVARKGFGEYLYDFMAMYAYENNKSIMSAIDGDTREGAIKNWKRMFKDSSFEKTKIPNKYREEVLEDQDPDDIPFLLYSSKIKPNQIYKSAKLNNNDVSHYLQFKEVKVKYKEVFGITYNNNKGNKWINEEYPVNTVKMHELFSIKKINNKLKF
jgi:hypothetical protein